MMDLNNWIMYDGHPTLDRIGADVVRGIDENSLIVGDLRTYCREEIRKPFSKAEFNGIVKLQLDGKLKGVEKEY